jgi:nucleoside-diphosphate-sugar epimerase
VGRAIILRAYARILITGGTGFIGQTLVRHLAEAGHQVRLLIAPHGGHRIARGLPVEVAVSPLNDSRLAPAMVGIDTVYHLAGGEWAGAYASLLEIDIRGTQYVVEAASDAQVDRLSTSATLALIVPLLTLSSRPRPLLKSISAEVGSITPSCARQSSLAPTTDSPLEWPAAQPLALRIHRPR